MSRILGVLLGCALLAGAVGCGGGSSAAAPTPTPVLSSGTPTVSATSTTVPLSATQLFTAANFSGTVTWTINPATTGSINSSTGLYSAPATFPTPNSVVITATSGAQTAAVTATIVFPNDNQNPQVVPIKLGTSGGNIFDNSTDGKSCCFGTLGSLINRGGTIYILSNNHVLARSTKGVNGESIDQPGQPGCPSAQGQPVANLSQQAPLQPLAAGGNSPSNVDAAIAQIIPTAVDSTGAILDLGVAGQTAIAAQPPSSTPISDAAAITGNHLTVAKSGRTTGLTCSTIQSALTDGVSVAYDQSCGGPTNFTAKFNGQLVINGGNFSAGGDSGSLIVTADTVQPIGLLYAGNPNSTIANTILDSSDSSGTHPGVLTAFTSGATVPTIVGIANPTPVSCQPTAVASSVQVTAQSALLSAQQQKIVAAVRDRHAVSLMASEPAIRSVKTGSSADSPSEAALLIELSAAPKTRIPAMIEGVRTKLVYPASMAAPALTAEEFTRGSNAKVNHRTEYLDQPGLQGIGVGRSDDAPGESAIVIYTIQGLSHIAIPAVIDGVRTKVVDGEPFRASNWNPKLEPKKGSCKLPVSKPDITAILK